MGNREINILIRLTNKGFTECEAIEIVNEIAQITRDEFMNSTKRSGEGDLILSLVTREMTRAGMTDNEIKQCTAYELLDTFFAWRRSGKISSGEIAQWETEYLETK